MNNQYFVQSVMLKIQECFALLSVLFSRSFDFAYKASFDYDPLLNKVFFRKLLPVIAGYNLHVIYVDIRNNKIQKHLTLDLREPFIDSKMQSLRVEHSMLHDCQVEGSYFLSGDSGEWIVFYDAESDIGVLLSDAYEVMTALSESVEQLHGHI